MNINLFLIDSQVLVDDFANPLQPYIVNPYKFITTDVKIINYMIETHIVRTDSGIIFEDIQEVEFYRANELQTDIATYSNKDKQLIGWNLYSSTKKTFYNRKYIKLLEVVASIGGFLKILTVVFKFLNGKLADVMMYCSILESIYSEEDQTKFINSNEPNTQVLTNPFMKQDSISKVAGIKAMSIKPKLKDHLPNLFKKCSKNPISDYSKLYEKGKTRIDEIFNITFMIKKIYEIESLKNTLLTCEEIKLFNMIRPKLSTSITQDSNATDLLFIQNFLENNNGTTAKQILKQIGIIE
jgi:hypothetical protein